jgi:uncharacterized protein (TIGR00251 family)
MAARDVDGGARLVVRAKPRSSREGLEVVDGVVFVKVSAAPEDGKANARVIEVVAAHFGLSRRQVEIVRGQTARDKDLQLQGITATQIDECLLS